MRQRNEQKLDPHRIINLCLLLILSPRSHTHWSKAFPVSHLPKTILTKLQRHNAHENPFRRATIQVR